MIEDFFDIEPKEPEIDDEVVEKSEKVTMFDYLNDIMTHKKGNVHKLRDQEMKQFNTFMILRFLSLDEGYLPSINKFNEWQDSLSKEEMYKMLLFIIPRSRKFLRYPKQTEQNKIAEEVINQVTEFFHCSKGEASEWVRLGLLSQIDLDKIKNMFGGKE